MHGARSDQFESLHPLHSSVGWSPDGKFVVAAARKGSRDALYVLDVDDRESVAELTPDLDALERPDWSPVDARFVFTGMRGGQVDLWTIEADGSGLAPLTDDLHEERGPRFSPDGRRVLFTTDRGDSGGLDLWTVDVETGRETPLVAGPGDQWDGAWSGDGASVYYVSDEFGTRDLLRHDLATGQSHRLTKLVGGAGAPSVARDGGNLAFTVYEKGRYRIVLVDDPDSLQSVEAPPVERGRCVLVEDVRARGLGGGGQRGGGGRRGRGSGRLGGRRERVGGRGRPKPSLSRRSLRSLRGRLRPAAAAGVAGRIARLRRIRLPPGRAERGDRRARESPHRRQRQPVPHAEEHGRVRRLPLPGRSAGLRNRRVPLPRLPLRRPHRAGAARGRGGRRRPLHGTPVGPQRHRLLSVPHVPSRRSGSGGDDAGPRALRPHR